MTGASDWQGPVGDVWADEWGRTDRAFAGLSAALDRAILAAAPAGPFRALDIGCGAGATSLALATARPDADVLGLDLSPTLIAQARLRARDCPNATFQTGDVAQSVRDMQPFDLLMSRHGVMFFADPAAAFTALRAATVPAGAMVYSCFADPELNDFAGPLARALGLPLPRSGAGPGPFAFADPRRISELLDAAGWYLTSLDKVAFAYRVGEGLDALDDAVGFLSRIGPAAAAMRTADGTRRAALAIGLRRFLTDFVSDNAVDLAASAWLVSARA